MMRTIVVMAICSLAFSGCGDSGKQDSSPVTGLDDRPSNPRCIAGPRSASGTGLAQLQPAFPNLAFNQPLAMVQEPNNNTRWYVMERPGRVVSFANNPATTDISPFIDIDAQVDDRGEGGLLGMAFHPEYAANGYVYLSYTTSDNPADPQSPNLRSVIARFTANAARTALDLPSQQILMTVAQPFSNHKGGNIAFGPDGFLYIGFGDGGAGGDPYNHGQDTGTLLGAMLRIDVNVSPADLASGLRYQIPAGNPFSGTPTCINGACPDQSVKASRCTGSGCPEIYAWGLRNPWRWSFDRATGDLWAGDVGQDAWEEVDLIQAGKNYGWNCYEGSHVYNSSPSCAATTNSVMPVNEYDHSVGHSITGGYVYRGAAIPALTGSYVFADFETGRIFSLSDPKNTAMRTEIATPMPGIASFAQGSDGEIYALSLYTGKLSKFMPGTGVTEPGFPAQLSATGCAADADPKQSSDGMIPYDVNAAFWSDGAVKQRWLAVPDGQSIGIDANGDFQLPPGSVLRKDFYLDNKIIETRLLAYHTDGDWAGYSYEWDDAQSNATLVADGKTKTIGSHTWNYPSGTDCLRCHTLAAGRSLGLEIMQLNRDYSYASTGQTSNQLTHYASIGLLGSALSAEPSQLPALANPQNTNATLDDRARAYLHTNCSQCHREGGTGGGQADFRANIPLAQMKVCNAEPLISDLGVNNVKVVTPGNPGLSIVSLRMHDTGSKHMPPLSSTMVDADGVALVDAWITALSSCP